MKTDFDAVLVMAQTLLQNELAEVPLTRGIIEAKVDVVLSLNPNWRASVDRDAIIRQLETRFDVWIGRPVTLVGDDDHVAWLTEGRKDGWRYWARYRQLLEESWAPVAVEALDDVTDRILGLLEDPRRPGPWDRRGLVVGHVQSGKTSNYNGLICKAADAGYKVIIVLAGVHKNLRSQTQMRLDEGFLGYETLPQRAARGRELRSIGVGLIDSDPALRPDYVTNRADNGDFNRGVANNIGINPGGRPLLFVVKKQKTVLENLLYWVDRVATRREQGTNRPLLPNVPLLLIDDEADHASVDTGNQDFDEQGKPDAEHDPKTINGLVRTLLLSFEQSAFVGYTATPFANIFIHDRGWTTEEGEDLFPRSFIINLPAPSNYDGPVRIFGLDPQEEGVTERGLPLVRRVTDHAASLEPKESVGWMPPVHKNGHLPLYDGRDEVPPSLREAVMAFLLTCAARRVRGQGTQHCSMLVHVARFTSTQGAVTRQVRNVLSNLVRRLRRGDPGTLDQFRRLWNDDYEPTTRAVREATGDARLRDLLWTEVQEALPAVAADIEVREINGSAKDILDYDTNRATGLKVIAIGGDKLARGLTLEGLAVSYFLRASRMYDTLMQMGRWFGYRPGYLDLCRLYMTAELEEWFQHITEASEELRVEFDHMAAIGGTPRQYGLKVKSHSLLTVTSKVKMRNATLVELDFAGALQETVVFHRTPDRLTTNLRAAENLIVSLGSAHEEDPTRRRPDGGAHKWKGARLWKGVPNEPVVSFLQRYTTHEAAVKANSAIVADFIKQQPPSELSSWTVVVLTGDGAELPFAGQELETFLRSPNERCYTLDQQKQMGRYIIRRLLAPRDEAIDLGEAEYAEALDASVREWQRDPARSRRQTPPDVPSGPSIRAVRGKYKPGQGLLLIYPLDPGPGQVAFHGPIVGFGVSFPASENAQKISYAVNNIYWSQEYGDGA